MFLPSSPLVIAHTFSSYTGTYFDMPLQTDAAKCVLIPRNPSITLKVATGNEFCWSQMSTVAMPIVAMLAEVGDCSNAFYGVPLNHRDVNPSNYYNSHYCETSKKNKRPMLHSFVTPTAEEGWTQTTPLSVVFVGIEEEQPKGFQSSFVTPMTQVYCPQGGGMQKNKGVLTDRCARFVTTDQLNRLCQLFGARLDPDLRKLEDRADLEWKAEVEGAAKSYQFCHFLSLFVGKQMEWSTKSKFQKFLKQFPSTGFKCDEDLDLRENICLFFKYVQSLIPIRTAVPDGQHRFLLYTQILRGVFEITPSVPLRSFGTNAWTGPINMVTSENCEFLGQQKSCQLCFQPLANVHGTCCYCHPTQW